MKLLTNRNQSGFTIIEVMIVLAIAGVIMLALFLAVPALQRNSRNNQRSSDAALIASSVSECLNNRNGQITSCNTFALLQTNGGLDTTKLRQLTITGATVTNPLGTTNTLTPQPTGVTNVTGVNLGFNNTCADDGAAARVGGGSRAYVLTYNVENSDGQALPRCLSS